MEEPEDALDNEPKGEDLEGDAPNSPQPGASGDSAQPPGNAGENDDKSSEAAAAAQLANSSSKKAKFAKFNIYLALFIFILLVALGVIGATYIASKHTSGPTTISSQSLSGSTFAQLANSDATVGSANQVLNVQSSAIFAGKVLVRQDLEVAGNLQIGGTVAINGLSVSGTAQFGQVQINKDVAVAGNSSLQGAATVGKSLQVNGPGTFSGPLSAPQITTASFQLNGDLVLTHHITVGGSTPSHSGGNALGSGGTASVSGSDTSGSVSINTGNNASAGCFITINFVNKFNSTPHVLVTPIGASAGALDYYVNRGSTNFSICDASSPASGASFAFDYFVID